MPVRSKSEGLSAPVCTVELPNHGSETSVHNVDLLGDCQYIGSYNWSPKATRAKPSIIVPGSPNVWFDPTLPLEIPPDQGQVIRDNNSYILRNQPFVPLLTAVNEQQIFARENWKTVDFITDRNGLRKLLRWIGGTAGKGFRIDTQLVGEKTVILNRWEPVDTETMHGNMFGINFEEAVTKPMPPATQRSTAHHRVVTYKFGKLRLIVQFEVDACLPEELWRPTTSSTPEDELVNAMTNVRLSSTSSRDSTTGGDSEMFGLVVHHQGRADIPNSAIIELATKSSAGIGWSERYPQLYLAQTGNHHMGNRREGKFFRIDKYTPSSPELLGVHERLQPVFRKLEEALRRIQSIVVKHGKDESLSLVYDKPNLVVHRNLTSQSCLPPEALELFN